MRQRRIIAVFLALALFLGMMPPAMAATSRCDYIGHSWGGWTTTKQPTCTQGGTQERTCTRCGKKESKSIAAKGHSFKYLKTEQEATCTGDGIAVFTCPQCSAKENRTIKAAGHEWDEGVVTQPEGLLEPGVKTYTCKKCGETRTEEISTVSTYSGKSIMDKLRNIPEGPGEAADELRIVKQPAGGSIDFGGSPLMLSVEAAGGTEPYSYQWYRRVATDSEFFAIMSNIFGGDSIVNSELTVGDLLFSEVPDSSGPECPAERAGTYYCRVTDDKGRYVDSSRAAVAYNLYISRQPEHTATCEMDPVILTCKAAGGTPFTDAPDTYYYTWYDSDGNPVGYGQEFEVPGVGEYHMPKTGEYFCEVEDAAGNTVASKAVWVYDADPFEAKTDAAVVELLEGQDYELWAEAYGGIGPYTGTWLRDGEEIPTQQTAEGEFTAAIQGDGSKEVIYTFLATDVMENTASCTVKVVYPQLKIAEQPKGGMLSADGETPVEIRVEMAEGTEPFTYYLYQDGEPKEFGSGTGMSGGFKVFEAGEYSIHIEDAEGRWADSDTAVVTEYELKELTILEQPESQILPYQEGRKYYTASLVCKAVAADGTTDFLEYVWQTKVPGPGGGWLSGTPSSDTYTMTAIDKRGTWPFRCVVTDTRTGEQVISNEATVSVELGIKITGHEKVDQRVDAYHDAEIAYTITGGAGPYEVVEYQIRKVVQYEDGRQETIVIPKEKRTVETDGKYWIRTENVYKGYFIKEDGTASMVGPYIAECYLVVTDSKGQTATSNTYTAK